MAIRRRVRRKLKRYVNRRGKPMTARQRAALQKAQAASARKRRRGGSSRPAVRRKKMSGFDKALGGAVAGVGLLAAGTIGYMSYKNRKDLAAAYRNRKRKGVLADG